MEGTCRKTVAEKLASALYPGVQTASYRKYKGIEQIMEHADLELLDVLLHKLQQDKDIMQGLSLLEQGAIASASETICSLIRKHFKRSVGDRQTGTE